MTAKPSRSLWFRYVCEPIGWRLAKLVAKTPITGNQISLFVMLLTVITFYLITFNEYILTGMILLQVILILDTMDGTVARIKKQVSLKGGYYEAVWHECIFPFFYFALGVYSYNTFGTVNYLIMGSLTAIFILIINLLFHRHSMIFNIKEKEETKYTVIQYIVRWLTCPSHVFTYAFILLFFNLLHVMVLVYFIFYLLLTLHKINTFVLG